MAAHMVVMGVVKTDMSAGSGWYSSMAYQSPKIMVGVAVELVLAEDMV